MSEHRSSGPSRTEPGSGATDDGEAGSAASSMGPALRSLDGKAAPADLAGALSALMRLPEPARRGFADLLLPNLDSIPEDQLDARIVRLCRRAGLDPEELAPPIKASRFLLRQAAAGNVPRQGLADDLAALSIHDAPAAILLGAYEHAFPALRREILVQALRAHGNVLAGVEWRVDTIGSSSQGRDLGVPVALLTLHYHDRQQAGSITIQLLPDMVNQIREVCNELLTT